MNDISPGANSDQSDRSTTGAQNEFPAPPPTMSAFDAIPPVSPEAPSPPATKRGTSPALLLGVSIGALALSALVLVMVLMNRSDGDEVATAGDTAEEVAERDRGRGRGDSADEDGDDDGGDAADVTIPESTVPETTEPPAPVDTKPATTAPPAVVIETVPPAPAVHVQSPADEIADAIAQDRPQVEARYGQWVAMLSTKRDGLRDHNGRVWTHSDIIAEYHQLAASYGGALMLRTDEWSFDLSGFTAVITSQTFNSAEDALSWCRRNNRGRDDCFAKNIMRNGEGFDRDTVYQ